MDLKLPPWSPACGHKMPVGEWPSAGDKPPSLDKIAELHYCVSPQLRQMSRCNRCFYDLSAIEVALSILGQSMSMLESIQNTYTSTTTTGTTTPPLQQNLHHYTFECSMPTPQTQPWEITGAAFTIGRYTLRGEENNIVAKHVINCIVSDISEQLEGLRSRMDKIWASDFQSHSHPSGQRTIKHQMIEQLIDDLLTRAWAAVGRGNFGF